MGKWKAVPIESEGGFERFEGLAGFEVLEDDGEVVVYAEQSQSSVTTKSEKKKTKKKKKKPQVKKVPVKKTSESFAINDSDTKYLTEMSEWKRHGIRKEILKALYDKGFLKPTKIQKVCVHGAITSKKSDIVGASETGSGKTFAYGIPVLQQILYRKDKMKTEADDEIAKRSKLMALIITPTRELACQVRDHLTILCKYTDVKIALVVGGLAKEKQERLLEKRPEIVIGTPGRIWEMFEMGNNHLKDIPRVKQLVIDEADRLLEHQHFQELGKLLDRMNSNPVYQENRRNFIFSATLSVVHDPPAYHKGNRRKPKNKIKVLLSKIGVKHELVYDLSSKQLTPQNLKEWKIDCRLEEKDYFLYYFLTEYSGTCMIFCNSIGCVRRLANILTILKLSPLPLHANMEQKQRLKNLDKFRAQTSILQKSILIATDLAARGLDIPGVDHVIHYQVPRTAEAYVHRSGRTARASACGSTLVLVAADEMRTYRNLLKTLTREQDLEVLDVKLDKLNHIKKIVHVARDIDQLSLAVKKGKSKEMWYEKAIREMDLLLDEDEIPTKITDGALKKVKRDLIAKQKELERLISLPNLPRAFSGNFPDVNNPTINKINTRKRKIS